MLLHSESNRSLMLGRCSFSRPNITKICKVKNEMLATHLLYQVDENQLALFSNIWNKLNCSSTT